jgi:hypothetical protein
MKFLLNVKTTFAPFLILACFVVVAQSCALLRDNQGIAKLTTQYAVGKFIENSSESQRTTRVTRIKSLATDIKNIAGNQGTTLVSLKDVAAQKIASLNLSASDKILALGLIDIIASELQKKIADKALKADDVLIVAMVMDWIIEAANVAG